MSAKSAITTAMSTRNATFLHRLYRQMIVRDINASYADSGRILFGTDGDVGVGFNATRLGLVVEPEGNFVEIPGLNMAKDRYELQERFEKLPQVSASAAWNVNHDFEVLGTNASNGDVTHYAEGGIIGETDGADNDQIIILPHLTGGQSAWTGTTWGTDKSTRWEAVIRTGTTAQSVTGAFLWTGLKLTNTQVVATDADQAYFYYSAAAGTTWRTVYSIGGTDTDASTGLAIAQNTDYHLVVEIDSSRIARFYINGVLYTTSTALTDATDLIPYIGVMTESGAAARRIMIQKEAISRIVG